VKALGIGVLAACEAQFAEGGLTHGARKVRVELEFGEVLTHDLKTLKSQCPRHPYNVTVDIHINVTLWKYFHLFMLANYLDFLGGHLVAQRPVEG
jgi:hypothetical protein